MTHRWLISLRMTVCAAAVCAAATAGAQTAAPASADPAAAPMAPAVTAPHTQEPRAHGQHHPKPHHKHKHHGKKKHAKGHDDQARQRGRYASPDAHEDAAARDNQRRGVGPYSQRGHAPMDEYQRNAFARCEVFKERSDREACVERVRQPGQGSVEGGGILREYTQQIVMDPPPKR